MKKLSDFKKNQTISSVQLSTIRGGKNHKTGCGITTVDGRTVKYKCDIYNDETGKTTLYGAKKSYR